MVQGVGAMLLKLRCAGKAARISGAGALAQAERSRNAPMTTKLKTVAQGRLSARRSVPQKLAPRASTPVAAEAFHLVNTLPAR